MKNENSPIKPWYSVDLNCPRCRNLEEDLAAIMSTIEDAANQNLDHTFSIYMDGERYAVHPDDVTNIFKDVSVMARDRSATAKEIIDWWRQKDHMMAVLQAVSNFTAETIEKVSQGGVE